MRSSITRPLVVAGWLAASASCTPAATQTSPTTGPGTVATEPGGGGAALDMSPVPAPKSLVVLVRGSNPKKTIDAVQRFVSLPVRLEALLQDASKGMTTYVDLAEPVDMAVALDPSTRSIDDPKLFVGFSVPLTKDFRGVLDLLEREGEEVEQVGVEVWRVRGKKTDGLTCEVLAPAGRTPRMVCGEGASSYRELGPWLARTLPAEPKPSHDVWVRVDFAPVRDVILPKLQREMDGGLADFRRELERGGVTDPELLDAPRLAAKELTLALEDLDRVEGGLRLDGAKSELSLSAELSFRANQSWITKVFAGGSGKSAPPPDAFWRLPKDSDSALFGEASDPALFTGIRRVANKGLRVGLDAIQREIGLTDADKQAFLGTLDAIPAMSGLWVSAGGSVPAEPGGFPKGGKTQAFTPSQAVVEAKNKVRAVVGWAVFGVQGDPARAHSFLTKSVDSYARLVRLAKKEADDQLKNAPPSMRAHYQKKRAEIEALLPKARVVKDPPGYPKGSSLLEVDVTFSSEDVWTMVHPERDWEKKGEHPKGARVRATVPIRLAVVPDEAGGYLFGYSTDPETLKRKLLGSLKNAPKEETLAARKDLDRLRRPMNGGGFAAYGRALTNFAQLDEGDADLREMVEILGRLPHRGNAPVFFLGTGKGGSAPSVGLEVVFDKPWIEDVAALVKEVLGGSRAFAPR